MRVLTGIGRIVVLTGLLMIGLPLVGGVASASSGTLTITTDTVLTETHYGSIVVGADDITLDCAYNAVIGPDQDSGILIEGHNGVTVLNCQVNSFAGDGIRVEGSWRTRLGNNTARWNGLAGIQVVGSTEAEVTGNTITDNGVRVSGWSGVGVEGSSNVTVWGNQSSANSGSGFYTFQASAILFRENSATGNGFDGFFLDAGTTSSRFSDNEAAGNGRHGFAVETSNDNRFIRNRVTWNGEAGFALHASNGNLVSNNDTQWNGWDGVRLQESDRNQVLYNSVTGNGLHGVILQRDSDYNSLKYNQVSYTGSSGIPVTEDSDWNFLEGNVSSYNSGVGFHIFTAHNTVLDNRANWNGDAGFELAGAGATLNMLKRNQACNNGDFDAVEDPDAGPGNVWLFNSFCTSDI
jgi:parallel beta-helix repeat protein